MTNVVIEHNRGLAFPRLRHLVALGREHGAREVGLFVGGRIASRYYAWRLGLNAERVVTREELGYDNANCNAHGATHVLSFFKLMRHTTTRPDEDVFIDYGSGMGQALVLAAMYPFRRVVGVELSEPLCRIAEQNTATCKSRLRCKNIEIVAGDATKFAVPDDATVLFFNNPFGGEILDAVLERIRESLERSPRRVTLVCNNYKVGSSFDVSLQARDWLKKQAHLKLDSGRVGDIYTNVRWSAVEITSPTEQHTKAATR